MSTSPSNVLPLDAYRDRRDQRFKLARSLHRADPVRSELLAHLGRIAAEVGADRVATVWVDEYGPGLVHPHLVLDLLSDRPRRSFSPDSLHLAWEKGVPGVIELTPGSWGTPGAPWSLAIALGSDGTRSWFLVADAVAPRPSLTPASRERVMFLAGECSSVVLHRDLDAMEAVRADGVRRDQPRFAGWPILKDIEGREDDRDESQRIAVRFVVARLPRLLLEDDLALPLDRMRQQAERAREEVAAQSEGVDAQGEAELWNAVLDTFEDGDLVGLGSALVELGWMAESRSHLYGASELYRSAYELFAATGSVTEAVDAARFQGRCYRRLAGWDEAHRWYAVAREVAEAAELHQKVTVVLDGIANIHRDRGNHPAARATLGEAMRFAELDGRLSTRAEVFHGLLALEHVAGNLDEALAHGWRAVSLFESDQARVQALGSLAGALIDAGELEAANDAWTLVAGLAEEANVRLYAVDALSHVAALRGDAATFALRAAESDALGWESGPAPAQAEVLLYRGLSYRALGRTDEARAWLERALRFAQGHGFGRIVFQAEDALESLNETVTPGGTPVTRRAPAPTTVELRAGLRELMLERVGPGP